MKYLLVSIIILSLIYLFKFKHGEKTKNKIKILMIICIIILSCIYTFRACSRSPNKEKLFLKSQSIYNKYGWQEFIKYVEKNGYFAITDEAHDYATPLLLAVKNKDIESFNFFIEKGASLFEEDAKAAGIIDYMLNNFDKNVAHKIIQSLPNEYWVTENNEGKIPFVKFISNCKDFEIIQKCLSLTKNINTHDHDNKTLLMYAAQVNTEVLLIKLLLDNGADLNTKNKNEWTAAMYAARYNPNPHILEDLILRGADLKPNSVGLTMIMLASCNPNSAVLMKLLEYVDNVNSRTDTGKTALMYACENKQSLSAIKILIANKADLNIKDDSGKTALMYALENYTEPEIPNLLIMSGSDSTAVDNSGKSVQDYLAANNNLKNTDLAKVIE